MQIKHNQTLNEELAKIEKEGSTIKNGLLAGYKRLKIPLLTIKGKSNWNKRFPLSRIKELRRRVGKKKFSAQMQLEPINLSIPYFKTKDMQYYGKGFSVKEQNFQSVFKINGDTKVIKGIAYWDPSAGGKSQDGSVLTIAYKDAENNIYIEKIEYLNNYLKQSHINTKKQAENGISNQIEIVISFLKEYCINILHIETNGIGKFIPELIAKELKSQRLNIEISEIYNSTSKSIRIIEGIEPPISAGIIFFHEKIRYNKRFMQEMKEWTPKKDGKDDGLDSLSGATLCRYKNLKDY